MKNKKLSSCERVIDRPKHSALTKFLIRHDLRRAYNLEKIIENCEVDCHLGCLPLDLRVLVDKSKISEITAKFNDLMDFFVVDKYCELSSRKILQYEMPEISELFGTKCILITKDLIIDDEVPVYQEWGGAVSDVYKLSFPEIGVNYAFKVFKSNIIPCVGHGYIYEIPTAFKANKREPRYNNPIYMANLLGAQWTLNKWVNHTDEEKVPETKKNANFATSDDENSPRNYCNGKRIDFGKTFKTLYGASSYPVRKLYRQMQNMSAQQLEELKQTKKNNFELENYQKAQDIIYFEYINEMCR